MRRRFYFALLALLPAVPAGLLLAADPFGRVAPSTAEPAPQVFVNPYAAPPPARLPGERLTALGHVVRVDHLRHAYRATESAPAVASGDSRPAAQSTPAFLKPATGSMVRSPAMVAGTPLAPNVQASVPQAWANAPATLPRDRSVVPATYQTQFPAHGRPVEIDPNPLRRVEPPTSGSTNPLR